MYAQTLHCPTLDTTPTAPQEGRITMSQPASHDPTEGLLSLAEEGRPRAAAALTHGQTRMAYLLASEATGRIIFCREYGWLTWTGTHWSPDHGVGARRELLAILRTALRDHLPDTVRAAKSCMSNASQQGVLGIAADLPQFRVMLEDLDSDPYLVNLPNGTFDLRTNELHDHDPSDRITKITRASFDPGAPSPVWSEHLEYFQPDIQIREFLQRFFGYTILGKVTEHIFLICYGPKGANGKGTTDRAIQYALGDYATAVDPNLLVATRANSPDAPSPARFALKGRRYVSMSETERRAPIAEALMKNLTGGDPIFARALKKDPVVFEPSHTLVLYTNHKPKLSADDGGVWRRVKLVPFDISRPLDQRDSTIDAQLQLEADAILTWMLEGYAQYLQIGLAPPPQVEAATSSYQYEEDGFSQFFDESFTAHPTEYLYARDIWDDWEAFVRQNQITTMTQKELYQRLEAKGFDRVRRSDGAIFKGITRRDNDPATDDLLDEEA